MMVDPHENEDECKPVVNGFVCDVTQDDLNKIKSDHNFSSHSILEKDRSKVIFTDENHNEMAIAVRNKDAPIRLFSKKKLL